MKKSIRGEIEGCHRGRLPFLKNEFFQTPSSRTRVKPILLPGLFISITSVSGANCYTLISVSHSTVLFADSGKHLCWNLFLIKFDIYCMQLYQQVSSRGFCKNFLVSSGAVFFYFANSFRILFNSTPLLLYNHSWYLLLHYDLSFGFDTCPVKKYGVFSRSYLETVNNSELNFSTPNVLSEKYN